MSTLGFACNWDPHRESTWSGTAWHLFQALEGLTDCVDTGIRLPLAARRCLQVASLRRRDGRWVSVWEHSSVWQSSLEHTLRRRATAARVDTVLEIQDMAQFPEIPYFIYQDLSYDVIGAQLSDPRSGASQFFRTLDRSSLERRRERQHQIYSGATGVIAMSDWFAKSLIADTGLDPRKVHVAHPGATSLQGSRHLPIPERDRPRRRLLFLGTTFFVKGGDLVLAALTLLREDDPSIRLTVAGPDRWPLPGNVPEGVDFLGHVPRTRVPELMDAHDLLVMPSRMEGFGIVFVEALSRGLPCVARSAFAMPEIIQDGVTGALITDDDPCQLADAIARTLSDDQIFAQALARAGDVAEAYTWKSAAQRILDFIHQDG